MSNIILAMLIGIASAVIGVNIHLIINLEPVANWWFVLGGKVGIKIVNGQEVERWFYRPLWGCEKCFSGQIALWWFLLWHVRAGTGQAGHIVHWQGYWVAIQNYSLFCHVTAICCATFTAVLLSTLIKKIKSYE